MLLAIDTIGRNVGVALWAAGSTAYERTWEANRNHTTELLPAIETAFAECGLSRGEVERLAVCTGPGSFSAARVGVAVAKTLGFVWDCPVYGANCFQISANSMGRIVGEVLVIAPMGRRRWATQILSCDGRFAVAKANLKMTDRPDDEIFADRYAAIVSDDSEVRGELNLSADVYLRRPNWLAAWAADQVSVDASKSVDELEPYYLQEARITMPARQTFRSG